MRRMLLRWLWVGALGTMTLGPAACDDGTGDDDEDVVEVAGDVDDADRAGDGNWEDGDAQEIRDHWD